MPLTNNLLYKHFLPPVKSPPPLPNHSFTEPLLHISLYTVIFYIYYNISIPGRQTDIRHIQYNKSH